MRSTIVALAFSITFVGAAKASNLNQVLRDTVGRSCSIMLSSNDPSWYYKNQKKSLRPTCTCAIRYSFSIGLSERNLLPSLLKNHRLLDAEGGAMVREATMECTKAMFGENGPKFRPLSPAREPW
jgi:hypothetical protein